MKRTQISLLIFCAVAAASAQTAPPSSKPPVAPPVVPGVTPAIAPPPVKMGLWEATINSQMSGFQIPPDVVARLQAMGRPVPGGPHTVTTQSCLTPDEWQKDMERMNNPQNSECTITHRDSGGGKWSFDVTCKSERGGAFSGHWEMQFVDDEHVHGSGHMKGDGVGPNGQTITTETTIDSHRLGADCGDVKPGDAKIIKQ